MRKRMKEILRDRRASSFPMTIGIVLSLIILMCGISEYFRLQVIAAGVREAVEDAVISTVIIMQVCIMESGRDILAAMFPLEREAGKKI